MNAPTKEAFKRAIRRSLSILAALAPDHQESYLAWTKTAGGGWSGTPALRPSLRSLFTVGSAQLQEASAEFATLFFAEYPAMAGTKLTGIAGMCAMQLAHDPTWLVSAAVAHLSNRHEDFDAPESEMDAVVEDLEQFAEGTSILLRFRAQLMNFSMPQSQLQLGPSLVIRRLTEKEISALYAGDPLPLPHSRILGIHEFALEGTLQGHKSQTGKDLDAAAPVKIARAEVERILRALRVFKEGIVGYEWMHFECANFCPLVLGSYGSHDFAVRPGVYRLSEHEASKFPAFAESLSALSEPALETACARLADAETRSRHQDQVLDAVIGMEAILLAALAREDRRSELKYRFSLNYSTLFDTPQERWTAYRLAKDLYDLRSKLAHGGGVEERIRLGEEQLTLEGAAARARGALRDLVKHFLPEASRSQFRQPLFWERAYFHLPRSA